MGQPVGYQLILHGRFFLSWSTIGLLDTQSETTRGNRPSNILGNLNALSESS
jgi:hypothetical protein